MTAEVRAMTLADIPAVQDVERAAGQRFRACEDPRIARCANDPVFTREQLTPFIEQARAWVSTADGDVVGFIVMDVVDGCAHVDEVAVTPNAGRRGHGAALLAKAQEWAACKQLSVITLTTFRDVPWNGPWYTKIGFRLVPAREWTPAMRELRDAEERNGLARELRIVMRRDVRPPEVI